MSQKGPITVSVTNGDATVTASGEDFLTSLSAGQWFTVVNSGVSYQIASITDDNNFELTAVYAGTTNASASAVIQTSWTTNRNLPKLERGDIETATIFGRFAEIMDTYLGAAYTSGALLFGNSSGGIGTDATNAFWDDTNNVLRLAGGGTAAALSSGQANFYGKTTTGAVVSGYGSTYDVTLQDRNAANRLGVTTAGISVPAALDVGGAVTLSGASATINAGTTTTYGLFANSSTTAWVAAYGATHATLASVLELGAGGAARAFVTSTGFNSTAIGATTPAAGSFTSLTASGVVSLTSVQQSNSANNVTTGFNARLGSIYLRQRDSTVGIDGATTYQEQIIADNVPLDIYTIGNNVLNLGVNSTSIAKLSTTEFAFATRANLKSYTVATLPSAATAGGLIYVSDETGGGVPAFSDNTNWRRVTDRTVCA